MPTRPRRIQKGRSYLITRSCLERQFLLFPDQVVTLIVNFVLAVAAARFGILVHAYCAMSNHIHLVVTDVEGRLPEFCQFLFAFVARAVNKHRGRTDHFWDAAGVSVVELMTDQDVIDKAAYVLANPVAAGLVRRGEDWPGAWSGTTRIDGDAVEVAQPDVFFDKEGPMPESAALQLHRPPAFGSTDSFVQPLKEALARSEAEAAVAIAAAGKRFLGVKGLQEQSPRSRPSTPKPFRRLKPRIACRDPSLRSAALRALKAFVAEYRSALRSWRDGAREVVFPAGTYLMHRHHGVCCAPSS